LNKNILQQIDVRIAAVGLSLLVSFFTSALTILPNDDAYTYVRTAEIFLNEGINAAIQHYTWAGYSLLIALISKLGLDLFNAAHLINAIFYALLVYSFISIVDLLSASKNASLLAAVCILLYPPLNEFRYEIIRDIALWALSFFSLWHFLLYTKLHQFRNLLLFNISLVFASFFRPEAIIYLFSIPLVLLFDKFYTKRKRYQNLLLSWGIGVTLIGLVVFVLAVIGLNIVILLSDFLSVYSSFIDINLAPYLSNNSVISSEIFGEYANSYSEPYFALFLLSGLFTILIVKLFEGIGGPFFWILLLGTFKRLIKIEPEKYLPLVFFLITNLGIAFAFILITRYVSTRYTMLFCLLLVLFVPLILERITSLLENLPYRNISMRVLILFFGYCAFDSFISFGTSKDFVVESAQWIATESNPNSGLVTNNQSIAYQSGKIDDYDRIGRFVSKQDIVNAKTGDFIAIEMHYEMVELVTSKEISSIIRLVASFPSEEDQRLAVYQRIAPKTPTR